MKPKNKAGKFTNPAASPVEDQLVALKKAWKTSQPEAEFSVHVKASPAIYVAMYRGGLVLRIGDGKKVAFLVPRMASRLGLKLSEMASWSCMP